MPPIIKNPIRDQKYETTVLFLNQDFFTELLHFVIQGDIMT